MNKMKKDQQQEKIIISQSEKLVLDSNQLNGIKEIIVKQGIDSEIEIIEENQNIDIELIVEENSRIDMSIFLENSDLSMKVNLIGREAEVKLSYSNLSTKDSSNAIHIFHKESNTRSIVYCNGYSKNSSSITFDVNGYVDKNSKNCSCIQDSKIIEEVHSKSQIKPNLYIENYDVEAAHSAYIGPFQKEEIFYLESRGIRNKKATELLVRAHLLGKLKLDEEKKSNLIQRIEKQSV